MRAGLKKWLRRLCASGPGEPRYWFTRYSRSIIFLILILAAGRRVSRVHHSRSRSFPTTNFPRMVIGVDNGVTPIDQMMVTVTRPIEEAMNSVPGLQQVRSITSRGSAEIDLFFDWHVDMLQTLQLVNAALAHVRSPRFRQPPSFRRIA